MKKFIAENTLLGQMFVKDNDKTVEKYLVEEGSKVIGFYRFEVGEGIAKNSQNFADEVAAQALRTLAARDLLERILTSKTLLTSKT